MSNIYLLLCSLFRLLYDDSDEYVFCILRVTMHTTCRHRPLVISVFKPPFDTVQGRSQEVEMGGAKLFG